MEVGSASGESASPENEAPLSLILCLPAQVRFHCIWRIGNYVLMCVKMRYDPHSVLSK